MKSGIIAKLFHTGSFAVVQLVLSLANNYILARLLDPSQFGSFFLMLNFINLFAAVFCLGITGTVVRYGAEWYKQGTITENITKAYVWTLWIYLIPLILFFACPGMISKAFFSVENAYLVIATAIAAPMTIYSLIQTSLFWSLNKFVLRGLSVNALYFFQVIIAFLAWKCFEPSENLTLVLLIFILSNLLSVVFGKMLMMGSIRVRIVDWKKVFQLPKVDSKVKEIFAFGGWTMVAAISLQVTNLVDRYALNTFSDAATLGKYQAMFSFASCFYMPFMLLANICQSYFNKEWRDRPTAVLRMITNISLVSIVLFSAVAIIAAHFFEPFMQFFFGEKFSGLTETMFRLMMIGMLFKITYALIGTISSVSENPRATTISFVIGTSANILLNFYLTRVFGVFGVLVTSIFTYVLIDLLIITFLNNRSVKVSYIPVVFASILSAAIYFL